MRAAATRGRVAAMRVRAYALRNPDSLAVRTVPRPLRRRARLDPPPQGQRRLELGSGFSPRPGYLHADVQPLPGLDLVCAAGAVPLPAGWVDELLSVHMIEHLPPPDLPRTLAHWRDLLTPGGVLVTHTPSGEAIGRLLAAADAASLSSQWAANSAIYGYFRHPAECRGPADMGWNPDHRVLLTFPLLRDLLEQAGFVEVEDVSGSDASCHHQRDWAAHVPGLCLEVRARRPSA